MLKKQARLGREVFGSIFKKARRLGGVGFQLLASTGGTFHASVVVSKKVFPLAVGRNRVRRRVYAVLADIEKDLRAEGVTPTGSLIVLITPAKGRKGLSAPFEEIKASLYELCKTALSR